MPDEQILRGSHEILTKVTYALDQAGVTPNKIYWLPDPEAEPQHVVGENYNLVIGLGKERFNFWFSRAAIEDFPSGTAIEAEENIRHLVDSLSGQ